MRATHLIYEAAGRPEAPPKYRRATGPCAGCGGAGEWDLGDLLGDSFTNWTALARADSGAVCSACLFCLKEPALKYGGFVASADGLAIYESAAQTKSRETSPQGRASAILRDVRPLPRAEFWRTLADPPRGAAVLALNSASGMPLPRHMPVASRVARGGSWVTYVLDSVPWDPTVWLPAADAVARLLAAGAWKGEIERGGYRNQVAHGALALIRECERVLSPLRGRAAWPLFWDAVPKPDGREKTDEAESGAGRPIEGLGADHKETAG